MPRSRPKVYAHKRHKKVLKFTKGQFGTRSKLFRRANEAMLKSLFYAYRDRRNRKRDMRGLWIVRINAAARQNGLNYNQFIYGLKQANVQIDRKVLASIAVRDAATFSRLAEVARQSSASHPAAAVPTAAAPAAAAPAAAAPAAVAPAAVAPAAVAPAAVAPAAVAPAAVAPAAAVKIAERPAEIAEPAVEVAERALAIDLTAQAAAEVSDDLTSLEGIGPAYDRRLRAAGITGFAQLAATDEATLDEIIAAPAWRQPNFGDWIAQAKLAAAGDEAGLKSLQDVLFSRKGDNLALIAGLGDAGVEVLKDGGITNFSELAQATPEQLDELFGKAGARGGNFDEWIAEAKLRAAGKRIARPKGRERTRNAALQGAQLRSCPQDLEQIQGIGRVYEQRLYAAGIGTFWEVGMVTQEELKSILEVQEFQDVDLDAIQADALRLARETDAMGQTWDGSEPDDFEELKGIGPVLERRLYSAGICTFEDLASVTSERLVEICKAPTFNQPDYEEWIAVAKARLRAANA